MNYTITCIESKNQDVTNQSSLFVIEPLEVGHGITLGTSIRRTLLSDLTTYAVSGMRLNDIKHEFEANPSLREDSLEILLNLKEVVFKPSAFALNSGKLLRGVINATGPCVVTASMFLLPYEYLSIVNPNQYICTITDHSELYLEVDIQKGKAFQLFDEVRKQNPRNGIELSKMGNTLFTDALFMPVKKVNFGIKYIHDTKGNIKESLSLEITTNGSISPLRAFKESIKYLIELFLPLLLDNTFDKLATEIYSLQEKNQQESNNIFLESFDTSFNEEYINPE